MGTRTLVAAFPIVLGVLLVVACGRDEGPQERGSAADGRPAIAFTAKGITLGEAVVSLPCELSELVRVLGGATRTLEMTNTVSVWDEIGVYAMARPMTTRVHSLGVAFEPQGYVYSPKTTYERTVRVGAEHELGLRSNRRGLGKAGFRATEILAHLWQREFPGLLVSAEMSEDLERVVSVEASVP